MGPSLADQLRDQSGTYLPRLVSIFLSVFDPTAGPKIVCQVPEGTVATALSTFPSTASQNHHNPPSRSNSSSSIPQPSPGPSRTGSDEFVVRRTPHDLSSNTQVLFDFSSVLDFVIPKQELCGHLITKATRNSKILGFPVWIDDDKKYGGKGKIYNRNAFIFNVCFVFERDAELSGYEPIVRKTGRSLRLMEESTSLLSSPPPGFQISNVLEQIFLDLNTYSESSVLVHDTQLDLWPLPFHVNPREINNWDVPIAITNLLQMRNPSWDVTLYKVIPFINGVNHVRRIAELAEVDQQLCRLCIQHLVYYSAILLVDLFQFSNTYAILPAVQDVIQAVETEDGGGVDLAAECEAYVFSGGADAEPAKFGTLLGLYAKLQPGLTLSCWIDKYGIDALPVDPRRMIQFGVIKGFLRRVYAYPVWLDHPDFTEPDDERSSSPGRNGRRARGLGSLADDSPATSSFTTPRPATPQDAPAVPQERTAVTAAAAALADDASRLASEPGGAGRGGGRAGGVTIDAGAKQPWPKSLPLMMDGSHHTDELCLKYGIGMGTLETVLRALGGEGEAGVREGEGGRRGSWASYGGRIEMLYF